MNNSPLHEVIDLISDNEGGDRSSSSNEVPGVSDSDGSPLIPPVGLAEGDEDDESSSERDVEMDDEGTTSLCPSQWSVSDAVSESETPPASVHDELSVPEIEREPYTMDHAQISPPFVVSVPVPEAFRTSGLRDSGTCPYKYH